MQCFKGGVINFSGEKLNSNGAGVTHAAVYTHKCIIRLISYHFYLNHGRSRYFEGELYGQSAPWDDSY